MPDRLFTLPSGVRISINPVFVQLAFGGIAMTHFLHACWDFANTHYFLDRPLSFYIKVIVPFILFMLFYDTVHAQQRGHPCNRAFSSYNEANCRVALRLQDWQATPNL